VSCSEKHTKYQPTENEWRCPWCGADNKSFYIEEPIETARDDCEKLHEGDGLYCYICKDALSGKAFAAQIQKTKNLIPCKHCKGSGLVKDVIHG